MGEWEKWEAWGEREWKPANVDGECRALPTPWMTEVLALAFPTLSGIGKIIFPKSPAAELHAHAPRVWRPGDKHF